MELFFGFSVCYFTISEQKCNRRPSLAVQWFRPCTSNAGDTGLTVVRELRSHIALGTAKKKKMYQISEYYSCILHSLLNLLVLIVFGWKLQDSLFILSESFFLLICEHSLHIQVNDPCLSHILQFFTEFVTFLILIYGLVEVNKFKTSVQSKLALFSFIASTKYALRIIPSRGIKQSP